MSDKKINLAILGATGNVGHKFLEILEERKFPFNKLRLLAGEKTAGTKINFKGEEYTVELACKNSFEGINLVLASCGAAASKELTPHAVKAGAVVIDNSSAFRMDPDVPLVIAGVNNHDLKKHKGIIANPNCTTAQLMPPLKALHDLAGLKRVIVSTYQSASGAGRTVMDKLTEQTKNFLQGKDVMCNIPPNQKFAFNVIPHIDVFLKDGYTKEETKVINESRKILGLPDLRITCTAARVPVYIGHSESVNVEFEQPTTKDQIVGALHATPGIEIIEDPQYPMPVDIAGKDPVYVGRIREDKSNPNTFHFWIVADNLRIGAALNAIKIAEELLRESLIRLTFS